MSDEKSPSACLKLLRSALVRRRRQTAQTAWEAQQGDRVLGLAADLGVKLKSIQDAIEAVDKAIMEEETVATGDSNARGGDTDNAAARPVNAD
jgi:hypothetical protein